MQKKTEKKEPRPSVYIGCARSARCRHLREWLEQGGYEVRGLCDGDGGPLKDDYRINLDPPKLSAREIEVLQTLCNHGTRTATAKKLGLRPVSIDRHMTNIRRKLDLQSMPEIIAWGFRTGALK